MHVNAIYYTHTHTYIYIYTYHIYVNIYIYVHIYICIYIYIWWYIYIYICIYIYKQTYIICTYKSYKIKFLYKQKSWASWAPAIVTTLTQPASSGAEKVPAFHPSRSTVSLAIAAASGFLGAHEKSAGMWADNTWMIGQDAWFWAETLGYSWLNIICALFV